MSLRAIFLAALIGTPSALPVPADVQDPASIFGLISDRQGNAIADAQVILTIYTETAEPLWTTSSSTDENGEFLIPTSSLPIESLSRESYAARLWVEADEYRSDFAEILLVRDSTGVRSTPRSVQIRLQRLSRLSTVIVLVPAFFGVLLALLNFRRFPTREKREAFVRIYSISIAALWLGAVSYLLYGWVRNGASYFPVFFTDFAVPIGVIVACYIGTICYVAYSVYTRHPDFFSPANEPVRQKVLNAMGGRMLISPYIALIAYGILATTFPTLNTGPFAVFFGFFTGMWIKPVMDMLNDVGSRFLSVEAREKLGSRISQTDVVADPWASGGVSGGLLQLVGDRTEYRLGDDVYSLPVDRAHVGLRFSQTVQESAKTGAVRRLGLAPAPDLNDPLDVLTFWTVPDTSKQAYADLVEAAERTAAIARVVPVFLQGEGEFAIASDRVFAALTADREEETPRVKRALKKFGGEIIERVGGGNELLIRAGASADPFRLAERLNALPEVEYAEVDLIQIVAALGAYAPASIAQATGASFGGAYAYDVTNVMPAWELVDGLDRDAEIRVAVIDDGVDERHPDLEDVLIDRFDAFEGINVDAPFPKDHDAHGTACAGLVGAVPRDDGMKGVGAGCRVIPIRVNFRNSPKRDAHLTTSSFLIKRGIDKAVARGADILSLSWKFKESVMVREALERAMREGRGGLGCLVVVAAGNRGPPVSFPGTMEGVVTVAATNAEDRAERNPQWQSASGPEVDIAAPGVAIFTTDVSGATRGWEKESDYLFDFGGTSGATAFVAGAAALALRANPSLTGKELRSILLASTTGVAPGVRSFELGHGRIDVLAAVQTAIAAAGSNAM